MGKVAQILPAIGFVLGSVLLGALVARLVGPLMGGPCAGCSADTDSIVIHLGTTFALLLGAGIYLAWRKRWIQAATVAVLLLPAVFYSYDLSRSVGLL